MHICTLFSEELTKALVAHLQKHFAFLGEKITQTRTLRQDSIEYQFEVDIQGHDVGMPNAAQVKAATAHFIHGYIAGLAQCQSIVKGEGEWERDAVEASVDNLS